MEIEIPFIGGPINGATLSRIPETLRIRAPYYHPNEIILAGERRWVLWDNAEYVLTNDLKTDKPVLMFERVECDHTGGRCYAQKD